jgi:hypothetical protein
MLSPCASGRLLLEVKVVAAKVATTIFSGSAAAYVAYVGFGGLRGDALIALPVRGVVDVVKLFLEMVYWTTTTFATVGYGDILPSNGYGQFVAFLIEVQAFAVVAIVFASLFTSKESKV